LYRKAGVRPDDLRSLGDLQYLPFTTKDTFRDHLSAFTTGKQRGRYVTTGGSTGIPFGFYERRNTAEVERAFMQTGWSWAGWKLGQRSGVLRGGFVGSETNFSEYDPFHRELALSSYYLTSGSVPGYLERLRAWNIRVLQAYPSSLNLLCDLIRERNLPEPPEVELVLLGSENVYAWQLEKFKEIFPGAKFFSWYGHCEKAVLAPWCEETQCYHCWPFYGVTEVVNPNGQAVAEGEEGEIIGTSLLQQVTPFIRYRTMDRGVKGPSSCASCGRSFVLLSAVSGRSHEVIVTRRGRYISMTAINMHDDIFDSLRQFQFLQEKAGEVIFRYVPKATSPVEAELKKIRDGLMLKLGDDVHLALQAVNEIPRTRSGKFQFLDQRLPIQYGDRL
jgi:phenylacetate-CoA ligase